MSWASWTARDCGMIPDDFHMDVSWLPFFWSGAHFPNLPRPEVPSCCASSWSGHGKMEISSQTHDPIGRTSFKPEAVHC